MKKYQIKNNYNSSPLIKDAMVNFINAFTLIELLVVTTIIIILSSSWIFYFFDSAYKQEIENKLESIEDDLNHLDRNVANNIIFDYEIQDCK